MQQSAAKQKQSKKKVSKKMFENKGIGNAIRQLIAAGKNNKEICAALAKRKDAHLFAAVLSNKSSHLGWYRNNAKKRSGALAAKAASELAALVALREAMRAEIAAEAAAPSESSSS